MPRSFLIKGQKTGGGGQVCGTHLSAFRVVTPRNQGEKTFPSYLSFKPSPSLTVCLFSLYIDILI